MTNEELIVYQAQKICELEEKNKQLEEMSGMWFSKYQEFLSEDNRNDGGKEAV